MMKRARNTRPSAERADPAAELAAVVEQAAAAAAEIGRRQMARAGTVVAVIGGLAVVALIVSLAALALAVDQHQ
jgi:hypothetical protein